MGIRQIEVLIAVRDCMIRSRAGRAHFERASMRTEKGLDRNESKADKKILDGLMANLSLETQLSFLPRLLPISSP